MAAEILWWVFAIAIVGTSLGVVVARTIIHSAIFLILSLAGVGAMYLFLTVEFMAIVQWLIYGGAVTVLILLALMLTRTATVKESMNGPQAPFAALVGLALGAVLVGVAIGTVWPGDDGDGPSTISLELISERLFMDFGVPFIVVSVVLLVALIGASILARQEDE